MTWTDGTRHIDGVVDVFIEGCDSCHGSGGNPGAAGRHRREQRHREPAASERTGAIWRADRPGAATWGARSATSFRRPWTRRATSITALPSELSWGELATTEGLFRRGRHAVPGAYCHGGALSGGLTGHDAGMDDRRRVASGVRHVPRSAAGCLSGPAPNCNFCHPSAVAGAGPAIVGPALHINGVWTSGTTN